MYWSTNNPFAFIYDILLATAPTNTMIASIHVLPLYITIYDVDVSDKNFIFKFEMLNSDLYLH